MKVARPSAPALAELSITATHEAIAVIERNVLVQVGLVDEVLDAARIATGKLQLDVQLLDIVPVLTSAVDGARPGAQEKGVRLEYVVPPAHTWMIKGDSRRLQQIFANLLVNALKFTPRGGSVRVSAAQNGSHLEVEFRDTGIGIDADDLPKLFEPLWQADGEGAQAERGIGLGLSIVRHIVQLHDGEVRAESDGPGRGTVVKVRLPLGARPQEEIP